MNEEIQDIESEELWERWRCEVDAGQGKQRIDKYLAEHMTNIPLKAANIWGFRGKTIKKSRLGKYLYLYDDILPESLLFALIPL